MMIGDHGVVKKKILFCNGMIHSLRQDRMEYCNEYNEDTMRSEYNPAMKTCPRLHPETPIT